MIQPKISNLKNKINNNRKKKTHNKGYQLKIN